MNAQGSSLLEIPLPLDVPHYAGMIGDAEVSFEFFPPKSDRMEAQLWESIDMLMPLGPRFVSVTYGAGGSTRERTHNTVARIAGERSVPAAAHLTCVGASKAEIADVAHAYWEAGVRHIVALRGDPPEQGGRFVPHPDGYTNAAELVAGLKTLHDFEISVAAYPEVHPDATCAQADMDNLKRKIDAGATRAITQFFFAPETYFRYVEKVRAAGIEAEIVPGIMPVANFTSVKKMAALCNTDVPGWMERLFAGLDDQPATRQLIAATLTAELCRKLYEGGVRGFHFYTLNRAELSYAICRLLGRQPQERSA
ncbi:MAG: methylenetetrahydrofolate reductase [NAD(P)H] [Sphingobium sp.]